MTYKHDMHYNANMSYNPRTQTYNLTVRGVDSRLVQLMRIAAVRMRMSQGEVFDAAMRVWLKKLRSGANSRFEDLDQEIAEL